ncbi:hypothetical protein BH23BAC1_BH23BAC1_20340 [soil metagenome]
MAHTVIGIFENTQNAHQAAEKLKSNGFSDNNIDISNHSDDQNLSREDDKNVQGDSISRFFNSLFGDNDESRYYSEVSRNSQSIVTVHATSNEEAQQAVKILDEYGAVDIDEQGAKYGYARSGTDKHSDTSGKSSDSTSIPIIEEDVNVGKRVQKSGGARIRSRIIEKPVEENLRLRKEKVRVERKSVDRPASEKDLQNFKEGETKMVERSEVPVVEKNARVKEEVNLRKDVKETEETIREKVRKTEVDVDEDFDKENLHQGSGRNERYGDNKRKY